MATKSSVELNPGTAGELVETYTTDDGTHRQTVIVAGTEDGAVIEPVLANGAYSQPVADDRLAAQARRTNELLEQILTQLMRLR